VTSTLQGARLYHAGQLDGFHTHIPVFLARGPEQSGDQSLRSFYETLLSAVADSGLKEGQWQLCECSGWPDNHSADQLVSYCWRTDDESRLIVVNLADADAQANVRIPWDDLGAHAWQFRDALTGTVFERDGVQLQGEGLYVGMGAWESYFLELTVAA
jgi:hypothetical protein